MIEHHFTFVEFFSEEIRQNPFFFFVYNYIDARQKLEKKEIIWYFRE